MKEAGWENRIIARQMSRNDAAIRRCCQEWMNNGIFQRHDGSGRPRATADRKDRLILRSSVTAPDSSLSTIRRATCTRVSTMTFHRRLIERNLCAYRPPYATCLSRLYTVEPDYRSVWFDQVGILLTWNV
ncbi:HTH_Tnp_Tc3_2 domain-containing protein [Trichonephila clavipes]|uniref:HTH_Tnp_Tc3_2 domain-containing protein n=1 Tax=Trichonephila clavipes TaxID=2585209 RepID=A0A8X7BEQ6_TRICX|nr:HTH_Tnp_Tc3_2 domain-containing protein [Trichonephila clavipes]